MTAVRSGRTPLARVLIALVGGFLALLAGCGGSTTVHPGTPVLTLSATNTHFASYIVTLDSITLTGSDGTFATPLFQPEIVDLARLTDVAELLGAPAIPAGTYVNAIFTIDYTAASIWADNNGTAVGLTPQSPGGLLLTTAVVTVTFDPAHPLVVTNPVATRAHITFDLEAFNTINLTSNPATVTVQPYMQMQAATADATPLRARGVFVITQDGNFIMNLRPLYDYLSNPSGALQVNISDKTYFNINGVVSTGNTGLAALQALNLNEPVAAYGTLANLSSITPTFNATAVYAGVALEGGSKDHFVGVVTARSGNTLTVRNNQWLPLQDFNIRAPLGFIPTATVTVGSNTIVTEDGVVASGLGLQSISVGQRVDVAGLCTVLGNPCIVSGTNTPVVMDATAGAIRLQSTRAWGSVNSATPNSATLDLLSLGNFSPASYTFTGTATGGGAVNPGAYVVNTGSIDESGTAAGTLLAVDGLVAPFGAAPPDFNATAITTGAATQQALVVEWNGGATAPFTQHDAGGLIVDLANTSLDSVHQIYTGPQSLDLKSLPASPLITTTGADQSKLLLAVGNGTLGIQLFQSAAAFAAALNKDLNGTNKVYRLTAYGQYNSASNTFVATRIDVALQN